jgi:hypothetical protein
MGADSKCDAIVGGNTCNLFNTNDGGICSMHLAQVASGVHVTTLRSLLDWSDRKDEWSPAIKEAHPTRSGSHDEYGIAMRMVGNRHSKGELVALVNWLLVEEARTARGLRLAVYGYHRSRRPKPDVKVQTIEWQAKLLVNGYGVCTLANDRDVQDKGTDGGRYIEEMARVLRKALA